MTWFNINGGGFKSFELVSLMFKRRKMLDLNLNQQLEVLNIMCLYTLI